MRQFLMYGLVGAGGTACHYAILLLLVEIFNLNAVIASSLGFVTGALINHELNRSFVFLRTRKARRHTLGRFLTVACFGFLLNFGIMLLLVEGLSMHYVVSQVAATLTVFSMTFALNKTWTFQT